jgi:hypothetical protein
VPFDLRTSVFDKLRTRCDSSNLAVNY